MKKITWMTTFAMLLSLASTFGHFSYGRPYLGEACGSVTNVERSADNVIITMQSQKYILGGAGDARNQSILLATQSLNSGQRVCGATDGESIGILYDPSSR